MNKEIKEILITEKELREEISRMGKTLAEEYRDKNPLLICPLKGSFIFAADLIRKMNIPCEIDFMSVSSYNNSTVSSGEINIRKDIDTDIAGRHVIIIEDIIDTGNTLYKLRELLQSRCPASLKICTLLDKPSRRQADICSDYVCFEIPDKFVIGYGMDVAEEYRYLPFIGVYSPN